LIYIKFLTLLSTGDKWQHILHTCERRFTATFTTMLQMTDNFLKEGN